jgi:adenine phosphoribosyltransferase
MEIQIGDIQPGQRVYIHDDLLATGGTAKAAAQLIEMSGGILAGMGFLMELAFLNGKENLTLYQVPIHTFAQL